MRRILNKLIACLMVMLVSLTLASCKASEPYLTSDYINTLVRDSGLGRGENVDESITDLIAFKVVDDEEYPEYLTYGYLALTLNNLIENGDTSVKALKKRLCHNKWLIFDEK